VDKEERIPLKFLMTTLQRSNDLIGQSIQDALIDQLRACISTEEILNFEERFNSKNNHNAQLHEIICELLRNRSISRGLAAKWLSILLKDKYEKISKVAS
tara:strand:- start:755 stop:1054 length:300 start_codon:yes stop_codon:yes gene_type:complete